MRRVNPLCGVPLNISGVSAFRRSSSQNLLYDSSCVRCEVDDVAKASLFFCVSRASFKTQGRCCALAPIPFERWWGHLVLSAQNRCCVTEGTQQHPSDVVAFVQTKLNFGLSYVILYGRVCSQSVRTTRGA